MIKYFYIFLISFCLIFSPEGSYSRGLKASMETSASAMRAQSERMKIITQNIANSETTGINPNDDPYRRKTIFFENKIDPKTGLAKVKIKGIRKDNSEFKLVYRPDHPAANEDGYLKMPNVDRSLESMDLRAAQRHYEANVTAIENTKSMMERTLDLMR